MTHLPRRPTLSAVCAPVVRPDIGSARTASPGEDQEGASCHRSHRAGIPCPLHPGLLRVVYAGDGMAHCQLPWSTLDRKRKDLYRLLHAKRTRVCGSRRLYDTTTTIAYAATPDGMAYLRGTGNDLPCDTNAIKDPASVFHFVGLNRIMLRFMSQFPTRYWLSDFQVRSDNSFIGANGLAKDYDSVGELVLPTGHVRFAVEYERWQQSSRRYLSCARVWRRRSTCTWSSSFSTNPDCSSL